MSRVVVVSNRVAVPRPGKPVAGGLATALTRALRRRGGLWFGWSGDTSDQPEEAPRLISSGRLDYAVVDLAADDYDEYYNGFSNQTLWPLMHYRLDLTEFARRDLAAYMRVNRRFARALQPLLRPDDLVWVHDYHLIPLAAELRNAGVRNRIGYFHHIPWPAPDVMAALPRAAELVEAMLAYDLVGAQTEGDAENLAAYLIRELAAKPNGRGSLRVGQNVVRIAAFPIGIETTSFARRARRAARSSFVHEIEESLLGRDLMIGVDRLDYSKGVPERMEAFQTFLKRFPQYRNKVTYLQVTPKSRSEVAEYAEIERKASAAAGRINGELGEASWTPIRYVNRPYSRTALAGLYRRARIGLVTPFRDGMNLVAKEYVAAQDAANPGVLVLSRFAGAAAELDAAIQVNPYDIDGVAAAIRAALRMPLDERAARWRAMYARLERNDVDSWFDGFVRELEREQRSVGAWLLDQLTPDGTSRRAATLMSWLP